MTQFYEDFNSYSDGAFGTVASPAWSVQSPGAGDWTQVIASGTVVVSRTGSGAATNVLVFDTPGAQSGDIEILSKFKVDMSAPQLTAVGAVLAASDSQSYGLSFIDAANVRLYRFNANQGQMTSIAASIAFAVPDQGYVWVRLGRSGTTIRAKIWLDGDAEPGSFQTSGTNTALTDLKAGIICRATQHTPVTVDVMGVGTGADSAPSSAGGPGDASGSISTVTGSSPAGTASSARSVTITLKDGSGAALNTVSRRFWTRTTIDGAAADGGAGGLAVTCNGSGVFSLTGLLVLSGAGWLTYKDASDDMTAHTVPVVFV